MKRQPMPELDGPPLPVELVYLWNWYAQLTAERQSSGFGVNSITSTLIRDFFALARIEPEVWEIEILKALDREDREVAMSDQQHPSLD